MTPLEAFQVIGSEFVGKVSNDVISKVLTMADEQTGASIGGVNRTYAIANLAAHILTVSTRTKGASGGIASIREGDLEVAFRESSGRSELHSTTYGEEYIRLTRPFVFCAMTREASSV